MLPSTTQIITSLVLIFWGITIGFWVCRKNKQNTKTVIDTSAEAMGNSESNDLVCPICFDTRVKVTENGRQWMVTTCGHVFCNECIYGSISAQHSCPNCRKRLIKRSVRPIYL